MNEYNMGFFFHWNEIVYLCYLLFCKYKKKNIGVKYTFAINNCIIFSKFPYHNCANRKLRKTSKQLLVIFQNKFPYK